MNHNSVILSEAKDLRHSCTYVFAGMPEILHFARCARYVQDDKLVLHRQFIGSEARDLVVRAVRICTAI